MSSLSERMNAGAAKTAPAPAPARALPEEPEASRPEAPRRAARALPEEPAVPAEEVPAAPGKNSLSSRGAASLVELGIRAPEKPVEPNPVAADPMNLMKERVVSELFERMGSRLNDPSMEQEELHDMVRTELADVVAAQEVPLSAEQRQRLLRDVSDDVLGFGPLQKLLDDPAVTEVMVNGPDTIFVERSGRLTRAEARFLSEEHLRQIIERIVSRVGRRIDDSSPMVDARLADGSRVNAVIPPVAFSGSSLTIRKFSKDPYKVEDLISFGTISESLADLMNACVEARLNIIVSGGTGSGKTTLLNVLSSFIPSGERVVTIEDAVELQLQQEHLVQLETRPANVEGRGEVSIRDLVRNSLRMRPDRIVIGECRAGEALDMLQAMNTGHDGSLSTVHSNSPRDAIARLETLVLMAGVDLSEAAIRRQIASAVDVIVQLERLKDGSRRVTAVTEVQGMEGSVVTLQDIFVFDYSAGVDKNGKFKGSVISTGIRPKFSEKFEDLGIELDQRVFAPPAPTEPAAAGRSRW